MFGFKRLFTKKLGKKFTIKETCETCRYYKGEPGRCVHDRCIDQIFCPPKNFRCKTLYRKRG